MMRYLSMILDFIHKANLKNLTVHAVFWLYFVYSKLIYGIYLTEH